MVISLDHKDRPALAGDGCSRLSTLASHLITVASEIAAGRIALFSRCARRRPGWFLLLSSRLPVAPIWTVGTVAGTSLAFARHPALRSSDFPRPELLPAATIRSSNDSLVNVRIPQGDHSRCRRGDLNSHGFPHYALNVARLPIPPLRRAFAGRFSRPGADLGTRTPDLLFTKQLLYQLS
jgi:hypothetical protein